jgi:hypothetical protein
MNSARCLYRNSIPLAQSRAFSGPLNLKVTYMSINEQGFLSPDITAWIDKHHAKNRAWFNHAIDLNSLAQQLLLELPIYDDASLLVALLFVRGLSSFQAAILLTERGMTQDARTVVRSCIETVIYLGAHLKNRDFVAKLEKANLHSKKTFANAQRSVSFPLAGEVAEKIDHFLEELERSGEKPERLNLEEIAKSAGLADLYKVSY